MADNNLDNGTMKSSTPPPSLPLSGFINGDTVQVNGDTGNLQFSLQFNIRQTTPTPFSDDTHFRRLPDSTTSPSGKTNQTSRTEKSGSGSSSSSSATYLTPEMTHEEIIGNQDANRDVVNNDWSPEDNDQERRENKSGIMMTRLRSGVLSPVSYKSNPRLPATNRAVPRKKRRVIMRMEDLLESVLRRHSLPIRPCNSYSFFAMARWSSIKGSTSFGETSQRLGEMWCKLPPDEKQVFEEMAAKDNARYKRQCSLLKDAR